MSFYALAFSCDLDKQSSLKYTLSQSPNGTPLCSSNIVHIHTSALTKNTWIYWIDNGYDTPERIKSIRSLDGVAKFYGLDGVPVSIYDSSWTWEDDYINKILLPYI
jgi:hypothetical protein